MTVLHPRGSFGNILGTLVALTARAGQVCCWSLGGAEAGAAATPAGTRAAPTAENYPAPHIGSVGAEKLDSGKRIVQKGLGGFGQAPRRSVLLNLGRISSWDRSGLFPASVLAFPHSAMTLGHYNRCSFNRFLVPQLGGKFH